MPRIALTGSHGTGKTTLLKILKEKYPNYDIQLESLTRKAVSGADKLNFSTVDESEKLIANKYMASFVVAPPNFIASRHMIDVLAYSMYLKKKNDNINENTMLDIEEKIEQIKDKKIFDLVIYIPIEFDQKESGEYREDQIENPNYQKDVDIIIKFLLWGYDIPYITVGGTVEQRVVKIEELIDAQNKI
jgi:predicted ATPase